MKICLKSVSWRFISYAYLNFLVYYPPSPHHIDNGAVLGSLFYSSIMNRVTLFILPYWFYGKAALLKWVILLIRTANIYYVTLKIKTGIHFFLPLQTFFLAFLLIFCEFGVFFLDGAHTVSEGLEMQWLHYGSSESVICSRFDGNVFQRNPSLDCSRYVHFQLLFPIQNYCYSQRYFSLSDKLYFCSQDLGKYSSEYSVY